MTPTQAREKVKTKFDIPTATTSLDAAIDEAVETALVMLTPFIHSPLTVDTSVSLASTDTEFDLPISGSTLKRLHVTYTGGHQVLWTAWTQHGDTILLTELPGAVDVTLYADAALSAGATVPERFTPAYVDYACSEFATTLAGSKSKYNVYAQATGARGVDNMLDLAEFYEQRAERRVARVADAEGLL